MTVRVPVASIAVVIVASVVLALSACGFGRDSQPVTIDFLAAIYRDGPNGTKASWDGIIADFHRSHADITVNLRTESWSNIHDVVRAATKSQATTPDILNLDAYAGFARDGLLYEAKDVLSERIVRDFEPTFAVNASLDGRQYAMPLVASTRMLFYNKELFLRAGLNAPPKTWNELLAAAKKITALGGGIAGYGLPLGPEEAQAETSIWTFGAGGQWSAGSTITVNTPPNLDGVAQIKKMIDSGVTEPNPGATNRKDVIAAFLQGRIGMVEALPPTIADLASNAPAMKYATTGSPTRTGSPITLGVADHLMAFVKDGSKRDAIKTFLDYFYSAPVYAKFVKAEGFIPITAAGADVLRSDPVTMTFGSTLASAKFYPANNPKWTATQRAIQQRIGALADGSPPIDVLLQVQGMSTA